MYKTTIHYNVSQYPNIENQHWALKPLERKISHLLAEKVFPYQLDTRRPSKRSHPTLINMDATDAKIKVAKIAKTEENHRLSRHNSFVKHLPSIVCRTVLLGCLLRLTHSKI